MRSRAEWEDELRTITNEQLSPSTTDQASSGWLYAGDRVAFERSKVEIPESDWAFQTHPRAVGVGLEAIKKFGSGQTVSPMNVAPNYFRPSAAEEKESCEIDATHPKPAPPAN